MMNKDLNSTHVFYIGGLNDKDLIDIEKVLTECDTTNEIRYICTKGYGFNSGSIQVEARWEDMTVFVETVRSITEVIKNNQKIEEGTEVDW